MEAIFVKRKQKTTNSAHTFGFDLAVNIAAWIDAKKSVQRHWTIRNWLAIVDANKNAKMVAKKNKPASTTACLGFIQKCSPAVLARQVRESWRKTDSGPFQFLCQRIRSSCKKTKLRDTSSFGVKSARNRDRFASQWVWAKKQPSRKKGKQAGEWKEGRRNGGKAINSGTTSSSQWNLRNKEEIENKRKERQTAILLVMKSMAKRYQKRTWKKAERKKVRLGENKIVFEKACWEKGMAKKNKLVYF